MARPVALHGRFPTIALVNLATTPLGVDLKKLVSALTTQLERDFVPIWGYPAKLHVADKAEPDEWQIVFLDDSDAADALGYHDLTKDGQPVSKVFVKSTLAAGEKVSVTASHELLEMLIDPGAQMWAQANNGYFYAYEMCDAVEETEYAIDGIALSNFVYPSFFESWHKARSVRFDHLKKVARPFQTLQNGYQIVSNGRSVHEVFGSRQKERNFRDLEIRNLHRSEYRKLMMQRGVAARSRLASVANSMSSIGPATSASQAAMPQHASQILSALATAVDPIHGDSFELAARRIARGQVDPVPGDPFEL